MATTSFILFHKLVYFPVTFVLPVNQQASINVLTSAKWMPETTPPLKEHPIYVSD